MAKVLLTFFCLVVASIGLELDRRDLHLLQTFDKMIGDWRIALGSPRAPDQRSDIAIVLVTEDSLLDYESRSPIDRTLIAELVRQIDRHEPRVIALDFIFDRVTGTDAILFDAIARAKTPIVLGAIDERVRDLDGSPPCLSLTRQQQWLHAASRPTGHVMLERKPGALPTGSDSTIRNIAGPIKTKSGHQICDRVSPVTRSFSDAIVAATGEPLAVVNRRIAWLRQPANGSDLFDTMSVPRHDPSLVQARIAKLVGSEWQDRLRNRVVIIGAQMLDRDLHTTPLSVLDGPVAGVTIHAQAVAQQLDRNRGLKRDVITPPWWLMLPILTLLTLASFGLVQITRIDPSGLLWGIGGFILVGFAGLAALRFSNIELPSIALATTWLGGGFGSFVLRNVEPTAAART